MIEISSNVEIKNSHGLHARPCTSFVEVANRFSAEIIVVRDDDEVNGKSIMGMMTLGAEAGTVLTLRANGDDAQEAVNSLIELVESGFGEE